MYRITNVKSVPRTCLLTLGGRYLRHVELPLQAREACDGGGLRGLEQGVVVEGLVLPRDHQGRERRQDRRGELLDQLRVVVHEVRQHHPQGAPVVLGISRLSSC